MLGQIKRQEEFRERYRVSETVEMLVFLPLLYVPGFAFYVVSLLGSLLGAAFGFVVLRPLAWLLAS